MRLTGIIIENFRGYRERTCVRISDFTSIVGKNDIGKSTLLEALEVFFNSEIVKIEPLDANVQDPHGTIRISCLFDGFPEALVLDASSQTSLSAELLLNSDGLLEIVKCWDASNKTPKSSVFAKAQHPSVAGAADLLQLKQADLKKRAEELGVDISEINKKSNVAIRAAIRSHFTDLQLKDVEVPLASEDGKKMWEQLSKHMPTFALFQSDRPSRDDDPEVQDPMKLAIQEAVKLVQDKLDEIKAEVERKAIEVAERTIGKLEEMDPMLASHLNPAFKAEPKWDGFKLTLLGEGGIPINKRGSGVRRLILLNFFRAEAERRNNVAGSPGIIYAVEEPENSQHPNNQAMLIKALLSLSKQATCQVLVTTHVPGIAAMLPAESVRYIRRKPDGHPYVSEGDEWTLQQVTQDLGIIPDNRAKVLVYVEGPHDVNFLCHANRILRENDHSLIDLNEDPRVAFVVTGGGNLKHWVNKRYLSKLNLVEVHIYDRDDAQKPKYQTQVDDVNARANGSWATLTSKREMENYLHPMAIMAVTGHSVAFTDDCDVPSLLAEVVHAASESQVAWADVREDKRESKSSRQKKILNDEVAAAMTFEQLSERDPNGEIRGWFEQISQRANLDWSPSQTAPAQEAG